MPMLQLYPFRFRDPVTGKWVRARHKLQVPEIQRHYSDWEITGAPEIRHVESASPAQYNPLQASAGTRRYCSNASLDALTRPPSGSY
jgi:hypothetical protein